MYRRDMFHPESFLIWNSYNQLYVSARWSSWSSCGTFRNGLNGKHDNVHKEFHKLENSEEGKAEPQSENTAEIRQVVNQLWNIERTFHWIQSCQDISFDYKMKTTLFIHSFWPFL